VSTIEDAGDLFASVYDQMAAPKFRSAFARGDVDGWYLDEWVRAQREQVTESVRAIGGVAREAARKLRDHGGPGLLALLLGLDDAFAEVLLPSAEGVSPGMQEYVDRWAETRLLNTRTDSGAVLPRWTAPGRDTGGNRRTPRDVLAHVTRVPASMWENCTHVVVSRFHDLSCEVGDVRVGCVPFLEELQEIDLQVVPEGPDRGYRAQAADTPTLRDRIPVVIDLLEKQHVDIGVLPECALSAELLPVWHEALRTRHLRHLRWIMVGTGLFPSGGRRPASRAVLLSTRDGSMVAQQDKQFGFSLSERHITGWGLAGCGRTRAAPFPTNGTWDESLAFGTGLTVIDSFVLRCAIAVCEDVARADLVPVVREAGITVLLVPIFAREIDRGNWEQFGAEEHVSESGAHVVVANSIAVGRWRALHGSGADGDAEDKITVDETRTPTIRYSLCVPSASQIGRYVPAREGLATTGAEVTAYDLFAEE
jgi:hypothetical protein